MSKISSGLLLYRQVGHEFQLLLCHPGGPLFATKDTGVWSLPKGEVKPEEDLLTAAIRECFEETGHQISGPFTPLQPVTTPAKVYYAWTARADFSIESCFSNTFTMFGHDYPEIDKYLWCTLSQAQVKIHPNQLPFIHQFIANISTT